MNCPQCGNRNPSSAKHCLHCNTAFEIERESLLDTSGENGGSGIILIFCAVVAVAVGGSMFLFGFDTYDSKCVRTEADAAKYEAMPEWERDPSGDRRHHSEQERRYKERTGKQLSRTMYEDVWCFRKKTGHVDGAVE